MLNLLVEVVKLISGKDSNPAVKRIVEAVKLLKEPTQIPSSSNSKKKKKPRKEIEPSEESSAEQGNKLDEDDTAVDLSGSDGEGVKPASDAIKQQQRKEKWEKK